MALLAVELDRAVLEITPHLEHFRSSLLRASNGGLQDPIHTHTNRHMRKRWMSHTHKAEAGKMGRNVT